MSQAPVGPIEHSREENGVLYRVERLDPPVLKGAGLRHFRLWENERPACGSQYHYELADAVHRIDQLVSYNHGHEVKMLEQRISLLSRSNRMLRQALVGGEFGARINDVMFEIKELVRLNLEQSPTPDIETQEKRIRFMLNELETR